MSRATNYPQSAARFQQPMQAHGTLPPPLPAQCEAYVGGAGPTGLLAPVGHVPAPHKLTATNREIVMARDYKGISWNLVKGPLAYDTGKQLERGFGKRSNTDVAGYLRPPKLVTPAISAPQMIGAIGTRRREDKWRHGGTHGAIPIQARPAMFGASDNPKTKASIPSEHPWTGFFGVPKQQLASNPYAININ